MIDIRKHVRYNANIRTNVPNIVSGFLEKRMIMKRVSEMSEREYRTYKRNRRSAMTAKKNLLKFFAGIAMVLVIVIGFKAASAHVNATNRIDEYKFYKTVNIGYGETLEDVAKANFDEHYDSFEEFFNEIKSINHVNENSAMAGGKLLYIPYYDIPAAE